METNEENKNNNNKKQKKKMRCDDELSTTMHTASRVKQKTKNQINSTKEESLAASNRMSVTDCGLGCPQLQAILRCSHTVFHFISSSSSFVYSVLCVFFSPFNSSFQFITRSKLYAWVRSLLMILFSFFFTACVYVRVVGNTTEIHT